MVIKARYLTWASYVSGGDGSAIVYNGGKVESDKVVRVDQSEERSDVAFYADDHMIDRDNSVNAASIALELAKLTDEMKEKWLGMEVTNSDISMTTDEAP